MGLYIFYRSLSFSVCICYTYMYVHKQWCAWGNGVPRLILQTVFNCAPVLYIEAEYESRCINIASLTVQNLQEFCVITSLWMALQVGHHAHWSLGHISHTNSGTHTCLHSKGFNQIVISPAMAYYSFFFIFFYGLLFLNWVKLLKSKFDIFCAFILVCSKESMLAGSAYKVGVEEQAWYSPFHMKIANVGGIDIGRF